MDPVGLRCRQVVSLECRGTCAWGKGKTLNTQSTRADVSAGSAAQPSCLAQEVGSPWRWKAMDTCRFLCWGLCKWWHLWQDLEGEFMGGLETTQLLGIRWQGLLKPGEELGISSTVRGPPCDL